jgi:Mg2+ and Co2+ transporter CorA
MSISKCPKCGKSIFQIESITPIGSKRDVITVICHNCSSIAGTLDHEPSSKDQEEIKLQMQVINKKLDTINQNIGQLMNGMKLLYKRIDDQS